MKGIEIIIAIILWSLVFWVILAASDWSGRQTYYPQDDYLNTYSDY